MTLNIGNCPKFNAWFRSCRFRARYDTNYQALNLTVEQINALGENVDIATDITEAIQAMVGSSKTYICDICTRCGRTVPRK